MDPQIAARFNDTILQAAMRCYAIQPDQITELDGYESFIYRFQRPDGKFILRIGHSGRRSPNLIRGEVDWINYLSDHGAPSARAILSERGSLVEPLDDGHGEQFLCTAFVHAPGTHVRGDRITDRLILNYGRLLGKMHRLAKSYKVSNPDWVRHTWDSPYNSTGEAQMPAREVLALQKYRQVHSYLRSLPVDAESYGMIHQDAHTGNFYADEQDNITLFDFDDCVYGHFIYDIAMVLFYIAVNTPDAAAYTRRFMPVFLAGYREENHLTPGWLPELPHFMKLREIELFAAIHFSSEDGDNPDHPWSAFYMKGRRERIENDVPFIDFDWMSLAPYL